MRKDGDVLLGHLSSATTKAMLCAPFIKAGVLQRLLSVVAPNVALDVVTRWHPKEVAAGVSDLEIFDLVCDRPRSQLRLLDNLHAKLYISDNRYLAGSANLTATALGWCDTPNLELLVPVSENDPSVRQCLERLGRARIATTEEREAIRKAASDIPALPLPLSADVVEEMADLWLPRFAAPASLYQAYRPQDRDRLTSDNLEAADYDLGALGVPPGLNREMFIREVGVRLAEMPAVAAILNATEGDLTDDAAAALVHTLTPNSDMPAAIGWRIVRDWLSVFMSDRYEIAPQSYITRPKPGSFRK
ncbi:phospholipase D family protein [Sinorhizobium medicae]|uniref:phospholipase D family protein n=1 Tax=Sinorhizobium medicae TaxID=110321 RepID=UPI001297C9A9|nr:phospholipase D family protein [Sinorhizobium medicae]MDX0967321.1 hypothetical protein [Sinorhizobium medicae]MQV46309.1 hypothetical protein [Sinorhizobium medicae]MQV54040.1 hypothetical protein [Sinorhizobium medicae]MQV71679.1 hypothetical protein [Sinorhizobium medicae]